MPYWKASISAPFLNMEYPNQPEVSSSQTYAAVVFNFFESCWAKAGSHFSQASSVYPDPCNSNPCVSRVWALDLGLANALTLARGASMAMSPQSQLTSLCGNPDRVFIG